MRNGQKQQGDARLMWRKIHALDLTVLLCLVFLTTSTGNGQVTGDIQIRSTGLIDFHTSVLYTVSKDGIYTVLSDSGREIARNTDAITIISQAITLANSVKGSVLITDGDYSLSGNIDMKSNVIVYVRLNVTFTVTYTPTTTEGILDFRGITNAHFITETEPASESAYPKIIGKGISNNEFGVYMTNGATYCSVGKIAFSNIGGYGICLRNADNNEINGTYVRGFTKAGGSNHHGLTIRAGSYNKLIDCHIDGEHEANTNMALYFGGEGPVTYNEVIGGIYENSGYSHAIYWCSETGKPVDHNIAYGGISRGCRAQNVCCGFKLNPATNSIIGKRPDGTLDPWLIYDCGTGLEMGDGGEGGNKGNLVYVKVINCRKGSDWWTQRANSNVQNNEVHIDVDVDLVNYPATGEVGYLALDFAGWATASNTFVQNNTIYLKTRNCRWGVVFAGWDDPMTETQEARYNTFYLDVEATQYAIYWISGCGGYGRYNTFNGYWKGSAGNCGSVPNADYVYTDNTAWMANIATNTFNPG